MLVPVALLVCVVVSVLVGRKLAFSRRSSSAVAAQNGPPRAAAQARAAAANGAHQKASVALRESGELAEPLDDSALIVEDIEMPSRDRSTDSSVITCLRIDPREILGEEPIESHARAAKKVPPPPPAARAPGAPQKLPSILEMMKRSSTTESGATEPARANAKVNLPRPAGAEVQVLPRMRAPRATPQAQPATSPVSPVKSAAVASAVKPEPQKAAAKPEPQKAATKPALLPRLPR